MKKLLAGCALAALATSAVHAQETTSSIRGSVTADGAPVANEYIKKVLNAAGHMDFDQWLHIETWAQGVCLQTADHKEGSRAFVEKRAAKFIGR